MGQPIRQLTIKGFKLIRNLVDFELRNLNVLIGANGSGKSNFVSYFRMLNELVEGRLQLWTSKQGGADRILTLGVKNTTTFETEIVLTNEPQKYIYRIVFQPTVDGTLAFVEEQILEECNNERVGFSFGSGHKEALIRTQQYNYPVFKDSYKSLSQWKVYHFHDTGDTARMKQPCSVVDNEYLRSDASNLAAFLLKLRQNHSETYEQIRKTIALAIPFFDDFDLRPRTLASGEEQIILLWRQKGSDYPLWSSQLSDGSLRFICLVTALLQPIPPSTIIIDEPELGLHPYAITLLGALLRSASKRMQVIVSTQSVPLLNEFTLDDLIVVERENDMSVFKRLNEADFTAWLEECPLNKI